MGAKVSLLDKVALITGASSGIGKATAHAFAAAGAAVVLAARRADLLEQVKAELAAYGKPVLAVPTDIVQEADLQTLRQSIADAFGRLDVLVNNAGLSLGGPLQESDANAIHSMVELNVYATIRVTQVFLPQMLALRQGHIVNISSVAGLIHSPGQAAYAATRGAVIDFSHALRRELAGSGVRVSVVLPGWTRTPMIEKMDLRLMRAAGIMPPQTTLDNAEVPARAIVDAVSENRSQVTLGGLGFAFGSLMHRLSPSLLDWYYRFFTNKPKMLQVLKDLG